MPVCKPIQQALDLNNEWLALKSQAAHPNMDPLLGKFIEEIEAPNSDQEIPSKDKFKQLFNRICDYGGMERKAPANLNGISRYSIEFYSKLLETVKQVQDDSLCKSWKRIGLYFLDFDGHPELGASAAEIHGFLIANQDELLRFQALGLSGLELVVIPQEINLFKGLLALNLSGNRISALPEKIFSGLTALQSLNLSHNQLTTLPENIFSKLPALRSIELMGNPSIPVNMGVNLDPYLGIGQLARYPELPAGYNPRRPNVCQRLTKTLCTLL